MVNLFRHPVIYALFGSYKAVPDLHQSRRSRTTSNTGVGDEKLQYTASGAVSHVSSIIHQKPTGNDVKATSITSSKRQEQNGVMYERNNEMMQNSVITVQYFYIYVRKEGEV